MDQCLPQEEGFAIEVHSELLTLVVDAVVGYFFKSFLYDTVGGLIAKK